MGDTAPGQSSKGSAGYGEISEDLASIVQVKGEVSLGYGHGMEAEKRDRIERTQNP